ncbi:hypothetical protein Srubr_06850 [Streptomyces rubradiris]|uniref:Uncharacterized protein n=1 Tax=Streptomyces rubradiris TaxID=285531 RepID=A0ABQ3R4Q9_STRRR|nr:hypothetical protein Srubr_06850 [Streptomyces rubradiris]
MFDAIRGYAGRFRAPSQARAGVREKGAHDLFEAAAVYAAARAEGDEDRIEEAAAWVSPEALSFGVSEPAYRAVMAPTWSGNSLPVPGNPRRPRLSRWAAGGTARRCPRCAHRSGRASGRDASRRTTGGGPGDH